MQECKRNYTSNDLIRIAKRDNNKKRPYLIVDPCQGKHIPVSPKVAMDLFATLGDQVKETLRDKKRVLVIAFAETATAIGAGVASRLEQDAYYMQTTRETIKGASYLYFSEAHSHATEQRLVKDKLTDILQRVDTIVFAEDEVTTGNTIRNLIHELEQMTEGKTYQYVIASILNGMTGEIETKFLEDKITLCYLLKTENQTYEKTVDEFSYDGLLLSESEEHGLKAIDTIQIGAYCNPRAVVSSKEYQQCCEQFAKEAANKILLSKDADVLVLGTEEFMYPALCLASKLEQKEDVLCVNFHATTRSPILTSKQNGYPLSRRIELKSLYDENRRTYIYNLRKYDKVVLVTDAVRTSPAGLNSLLYALETAGNKDVVLVEWRD